MNVERMLDFARSVFEKTRLRVFRVLLQQELCVCELAEVFRLSSPRMSQHLQTLRRAGVVTERREGKWVFYAADPKAIEAFNRIWREYLQTPLGKIPSLAREAAALKSEALKTLRMNCPGQTGP